MSDYVAVIFAIPLYSYVDGQRVVLAGFQALMRDIVGVVDRGGVAHLAMAFGQGLFMGRVLRIPHPVVVVVALRVDVGIAGVECIAPIRAGGARRGPSSVPVHIDFLT